MVRGKETEPNSQEFKVVANKGELVHRWLTFMREAEELPVGGVGHSDLILSEASFNDPLIEGVSSKVHLRGNNFEMTGLYIIKQEEGKSQSSSSSLIAPGRQQSMGHGILMSLLGGGRGEPQFTSSQLQSALESQMNKEEYDIEYDEDEDEFNIKTKDDPELADTSIVIALRNHPLMGSACGMDMTSRLDRDKQDFEKKYQKFGNLMEKLASAIYKTKDRVPPGKTITLEPPEDTEEDLIKKEHIVRISRRQLGALGFDDADMDREIDERIFFESRPSETFDDVGGQPKAKEELETLAYSLKDPEIFERWGTEPPKGVLLYGPPGTGKTLLSRALANKAEAGIFEVELADVVHSLYGRSEKFVQRVFEKARENAPSIIFFDELDSLARNRQYSDNVSSRILNVILTNMDGMREKESNVMVVGSTNMLDTLDPALLRAGRFDVLVEVPIPNAQGRGEIFNIHMKRALERSRRDDLYVPDFDLEKLIEATDKFSGADIREVLRRGLNKKVRQELEGLSPGPLSADDVMEEVRNYEDIRIEKERTWGLVPRNRNS